MIQDFFVKYYDVRPFKSVFINKIVGNSSKICGYLANVFLPLYFIVFPAISRYSKKKDLGECSDVIVSFTSFPKRIGVVWLVVECLLRQTYPPKKIVLWLSRDQFPSMDSIPRRLKKYVDKAVLELNLVEGDIRSHKKYWYTVQKYHLQPIILIDDDIIYDSHLIENLLNKSDNKYIAAVYCHRINRGHDGKVLPYSKWRNMKVGKNTMPDMDFFFGSGGGTYFPAGSLLGADAPISSIMSCCPTADDIWLNAVVRKNGYKVIQICNKISVPEWFVYSNTTLHSVNNGENRNDHQLFKVIDFFREQYSIDPFQDE